MSKIELFVLKDKLEKAIDKLHELGILHIEQAHLTKIMEQRGISRIILSPEEEREKASLEALLREINEVIQELKGLARSCMQGTERFKGELKGKPLPELAEIVSKQIKPQLNSLTQEIATLKDEQAILPQYKEILESFLVSKRELKIHENMTCLALIFDRRYEKEMQIFKKHLEDKTKGPLEVYISPLNIKKIVALLFYPPLMAKQIDEEIFKKGTIKIELPLKFLSLPLDDTIQSITSRLNQIPSQMKKLNQAIFDFAKENLSMLCTIKTIALNRLDEIQVQNNLVLSKYTAVITGWLPTKDLMYLNRELERALVKDFALYDRTQFVKHPQQIPVLLENPQRLKPYELLLSLLPPPQYGTKDATGLVSLFFPLFCGLIIGDIGYGLIFLFISLFFRKTAKYILRSLGAILFAVSLSSVFFGILFGEFFGNLGRDYFKLPHLLFDRHSSIIPFLILVLSVGVFHIILGFILGIMGAIRQKHKKEEVEKIAILGGIVGLFLLVATVVKILPSRFLPPSIAILVVVTVLLVVVRGFLGPLEVISAVANILSYARLMALGLAGVMMANIANHIGGLPENIFIGIILASLLHALNLVLSIFSPTVQSLRLHYVEFFSKFYEPGGKRYSPFKMKTQLTE